jgi:hypothetical protein
MVALFSDTLTGVIRIPISVYRGGTTVVFFVGLPKSNSNHKGDPMKRFSLVVLIDGSWKMAYDMWNTDIPAPAMPPEPETKKKK